MVVVLGFLCMSKHCKKKRSDCRKIMMFWTENIRSLPSDGFLKSLNRSYILRKKIINKLAFPGKCANKILLDCNLS